ncbi:MAG: hypothetical protein AAGD32_08645 [Planctomycetota bacterium]
MALSKPLLRRLHAEVCAPPPTPAQGVAQRRLADDADRLWTRLTDWLGRGDMVSDADNDALQLACWALQLPSARGDLPTGKFGVASMRDRAERSAELLVTDLADDIDDDLLDRTVRLLQELHRRPPMLEEAKLLSDAVNLDDFGIGGFVQQVGRLAISGDGLTALLDATRARSRYGYWTARLGDEFHFDFARQLAEKRLETWLDVARLLEEEV